MPKSPHNNMIYCCWFVQDDTALLFLGQCFESGFGVQQNLRKAFEYYKQAARAGNQQAKTLLAPQSDLHSKGKGIFVWTTRFCVLLSGATAFVVLLKSQDHSEDMLSPLALLCCSGGGRAALHPFFSMFFRRRPSTAAAPFHSRQRCAPLLEHREPVCPPRTLLPSPPSPQQRGCNLPVDCRDGLNKYSKDHVNRNPLFMYLKQRSIDWSSFDST